MPLHFALLFITLFYFALLWLILHHSLYITLYHSVLLGLTLSETLLQQADAHPWEEKQKIAFFRGSRTSGERDPIVLLSR